MTMAIGTFGTVDIPGLIDRIEPRLDGFDVFDVYGNRYHISKEYIEDYGADHAFNMISEKASKHALLKAVDLTPAPPPVPVEVVSVVDVMRELYGDNQ